MGVLAQRAALAGTVAAALILIPLQLVQMGAVLLIWAPALAPLPVLLAGLRYGPKAALIASGVCFLAIAISLKSIDAAVAAVILCGVFPPVAARVLRNGWGMGFVILTALGAAALTMTLIFLISALSGGDMAGAVAGSAEQMREMFVKEWARMGGIDPLTRNEAQDNLAQTAALVSAILPMIIGAVWFVIQIGNVLLLRLLDSKSPDPLIPPEELTQLRHPFGAVWLVIGLGAIGWAIPGNIGYLGRNLALLFLFGLYFPQGIAVVAMAFARFQIAYFIRGAFFAGLLMMPQLSGLITLLGLFDTWFDFRARFAPVDDVEPSDPADPAKKPSDSSDDKPPS